MATVIIRPNSDISISANATRSSGTNDYYTYIDEATLDAGDYIGAPEKATFQGKFGWTSSGLASVDSINSLTLCADYMNNSTVLTNGYLSEDDNISQFTFYNGEHPNYKVVMTTNPDTGNAWSLSEIESLVGGMQALSSDKYALTLYQLYIVVDYEEAKDYIVANCETADFNGTYIQVEPSEWHRFDGGMDYYLYYYEGQGCMVLHGGDGSAFYIDNNYGGDLPPDDPSIDWYNAFDEPPTPSSLTVTAAPSGTTHEGEVALSSLSYLRTKKETQAPSTNIIVSGAGATEVNGTYVESGTEGGKPQYTMGDSYVAWFTSFEGEGWYINGERRFYYSADDVATPDLVTTWTVATYGTSPVPTVTAE